MGTETLIRNRKLEHQSIYIPLVATEDFYGQVGLALSAWKSTNFQLAYSSYGAALPLASTTEQRSHILAAMATIAYKFQVKFFFSTK